MDAAELVCDVIVPVKEVESVIVIGRYVWIRIAGQAGRTREDAFEFGPACAPSATVNGSRD